MRGRKPQPAPPPNAYAMIPQFMYALLGAGSISASAFALWATIRLYARDQERHTFSPGPVALTTAQLAQMMNVSETYVKNLICELETSGLLERCAGVNSRQLQLRAPAGITSHSIYRSLYLPVNAKEEDLDLQSVNLETPPPKALALEGGMGGTVYPSPELPVNQMPGNSVTGNSSYPSPELPVNQVPGKTATPNLAAIAALLRERGAFPAVANAIAERLIAAGITEVDAVRTLVNTVIQQVLNEGAKEHQVIGRVMKRLREGTWDMDAVRARAVTEAQMAAYVRYVTAVPADDAEDAAAEDAAAEVATAAAPGATLARVAEAATLWQQTLEQLRLETTTSLFNTWLLNTRGLGYNGDGSTLVIAAHNAAAVEWLSGRLLPVVQRALRYTNGGAEVPVRFVTGVADGLC